jgi:hypothetical protein
MQGQHLLVRESTGEIIHVHSTDARAPYYWHLLHGRSVALVAPRTATREQLRQARDNAREGKELLQLGARLIEQGRKDAAADARRWWDAEHHGAVSITAAVKKLGGIKPPGRDYPEWRQEIPLGVVSRRARQGIDGVVSELRTYGFHVRGPDELYQALADRDRPQWSRAAAERAAVDEFMAVQPYTEVLDELRRTLDEQPRLRRRKR